MGESYSDRATEYHRPCFVSSISDIMVSNATPSHDRDWQLSASPPGWNSPPSTWTSFGTDEIREMQEDAVTVARSRPGRGRARRHHRRRADSPGFQLVLLRPPRRTGSARANRGAFSVRPAHDQRGKHNVTGTLSGAARTGCGRRVQASPSHRAGRLRAQSQRPRPVHAKRATDAERAIPGSLGSDRSASSRSCARNWKTSLQAGCREITVDEPSMSCYAHT